MSLRFFTAAGELPACGHGTVSALAFLAMRADSHEYRAELRASGRSFRGQAVRHQDGVSASFDAGVAAVRDATRAERDLAFESLGSDSDLDMTGICVAALGRERLLVPIGSRSALGALILDLGRLRDGCDGLGLLGCFVYSPPSPAGRLAARMFAPSIGVPEDIANANSTACLAAILAPQGLSEITLDMGDCLGRPATIQATVQLDGTRPRIWVASPRSQRNDQSRSPSWTAPTETGRPQRGPGLWIADLAEHSPTIRHTRVQRLTSEPTRPTLEIAVGFLLWPREARGQKRRHRRSGHVSALEA